MTFLSLIYFESHEQFQVPLVLLHVFFILDNLHYYYFFFKTTRLPKYYKCIFNTWFRLFFLDSMNKISYH